jgi:tetratricopeptide (TPR) repeat protein
MVDANQGGPSGRIRELETKYRSHPDSKLFVQLAEEYRNAGLYEKAIEICKDGLKKYPNYASALVTLGNAYLGLGKWSDARAELEKAVEISPENIRANKLLGIACLKAGNLAAAVQRFKLVQMLNPGDAEVLRYIHEIEGASATVSPAAVFPGESKARRPKTPEPIRGSPEEPSSREGKAEFPGAGFSDDVMDLKIDESVILNAQQSDQLRGDVGAPAETPEGGDSALDEIFGGIPGAGNDELSEFSAPTVMMSTEEFMAKFGVSENGGGGSEAAEQEDEEEGQFEEPIPSAPPAEEMGMEIDSLSDFSAPTMMMSADELARLAGSEAVSKEKGAESPPDDQLAPAGETAGEGGESLEELFPEAFSKDRISSEEEIFGGNEDFSLSTLADNESSEGLLNEGAVESVFGEDGAVLDGAPEGLPGETTGEAERAREGRDGSPDDMEPVMPTADEPESLFREEEPQAEAGDFEDDRTESVPFEGDDDFSTRLDLGQIVQEVDELTERKTESEAAAGEGALSSQTLAELYVQQGHLEKALEVYRDILSREPENQAVRERAQVLAARLTGEMKGSFLKQREAASPAEPASFAGRPAPEKVEAVEMPLSALPEEPAEADRPSAAVEPETAGKQNADRKKKVDRLSSWLSAYKKQKKS